MVTGILGGAVVPSYTNQFAEKKMKHPKPMFARDIEDSRNNFPVLQGRIGKKKAQLYLPHLS